MWWGSEKDINNLSRALECGVWHGRKNFPRYEIFVIWPGCLPGSRGGTGRRLDRDTDKVVMPPKPVLPRRLHRLLNAVLGGWSSGSFSVCWLGGRWKFLSLLSVWWWWGLIVLCLCGIAKGDEEEVVTERVNNSQWQSVLVDN